MKQAVVSSQGPRPAGPYSQGIRIGDRLYTAGFGPQNPETGAVPAGIYAQTRQVLTNIRNVLAAGEAGLNDVIKVTAYLLDIERDFEEYNRAYGEFFSEPYPVRTTVGAHLSGILVEIDVIAECPHNEHELSAAASGQ